MPQTQPPLLACMLLDAYEAFERAADNVPAPGRGGALARVNSAGWIVAHVADQQDRFWNCDLQRLPADEWLAANGDAFRPRAQPATPPFDEARASLARVFHRARGFLSKLDDAGLASLSTSVEGRPHHMQGDSVEQLLVRSVTHLFVHAGELEVIATLVGGADPGLPGRLEYSRGLRAVSS